MKRLLLATVVAVPLALGAAGAIANEMDENLLVEEYFEYLAFEDFAGYRAMQAALDPSSIPGNPKQGTYEATELDNYGHAWIYLSALTDYDPLSIHVGSGKRAYACHLTARRNAMAASRILSRVSTAGAWLELAERCGDALRATLVRWAGRASFPLAREDFRGSAPYRVFFPFDTATITAISDNVLAYIAQFEQAQGAAHIVVAGHADRSGQATYNMTLSRKRADAVGAKFATYTKSDRSQRIQAVGETKPLAATRDGIRHPRNRRVEIMIGRL